MKIPTLMCAALAAAMLIAIPARAAEESGAALYKRNCASCHGANGSGQTAMGKSLKLKDLRSPEIQKMSDDELYQVIAKGKGKMPAYESKLGKQGVHSLVAYMRTLGKSEGKKK